MNCKCSICSHNQPFSMPEEIIDAAINGDLVVFCGAGISTEGKNVLPESFYSCVKNELNIEDDISFCELMQQYCSFPNGRKKLLTRIRERFNHIDSFPELHRQATAFHRELSKIYQIKTIITTNWDTYFEDYCGAIPVTIPEDVALLDDTKRHVIKIHGSINNLSSVIATTDDYANCYNKLQNGVIGARLKNILCTKTIVFIGFSFGDDDFSQILDYLRTEMGDVFPHIYIVTLDETLSARLQYDHSTTIVTAGTFFVHSLKDILKQRGAIVNDNVDDLVSVALSVTEELHSKIARINTKKYPSVIFTLAYQDGIIHAFERYQQMSKTGEYNQPGYISLLARKYEDIQKRFHKAKNYWDAAYYEGYINGLVFIAMCEDNSEVLEQFPLLYLPNAKEPLSSLQLYHDELERVSTSRSMYHRWATAVVKDKCDDELTLHHPPY